jgi:DNA polymerase-3 subunit delta
MTITLTGNNAFALKLRLDELISNFIEKHGELAIEKIDVEEAEAQTILEAVQSLPFLATRKMVVVRNLSANKASADQVEQIISSASHALDLIFYEPSADRRTVFYKTLKSKTQLEEYNELDSHGLTKWLEEEAKERGGEISVSDGSYLVERVGANQSLLSNELDKLIIYNPKISRRSIDELTEPTPQSKIFELLDAAFGNDKQKALRLYEEQRAQKIEPQVIVGMLAWQLELMILAKLGEGKSTAQIAKDSGTNPYPVTKAARLVNKLSEDRLKEIVHEAFRLDWRAKTSGIDLDEALRTYIATL